MRQFASPGFRLSNLGLEAKVLYTAFCLLTSLGIVSSALYYGDLVGAGTQGIRRYYAGHSDTGSSGPYTGPPGPSPAREGPSIQVPDDDAEAHAPIVVAASYRKLLEVTHFHLFTMPVVLLIVGHLLLATDLGRRTKLAWIVAAAASMVIHLATPWLVRYGSAAFAPLHALGGAALTLTMSVLTIYPVVSMWGPKRSAAPAARS
jgi:hypothetical protein